MTEQAMSYSKTILSLIFLGGLSACTPPPTESSETLTIYSARHYDSDQIIYQTFEQMHGVKVEVREAKADQLLETLKAEGDNSEADLVIASDAGALWRFSDAGLTQKVSAPEIVSQIPAAYHDPDGDWFSLSRRLRLVAFDPDMFQASDLDTWGKLADPAKSGEICVRSSSNIYNLSLMGEMIARVGPDEASEWAAGIVANMARQPQGGDTDQIRAVAAGECGIAIANHYYWARLADSGVGADRAVAEATRLVVPGFGDDLGAHINITGVAITKTAGNVDLALDFVSFLLSEEGQALLVEETKELPLTSQISAEAAAGDTDSIASVERSSVALSRFGENQAEAQILFDLAGWN